MINFRLNIANIIISFICDNSELSYEPSANDEFKNFVYKGSKRPDIDVDIKYGYVPPLKLEKKVFEVKYGRQLYVSKKNLLYVYRDRKNSKRIERILEVNRDLNNIMVYVNKYKTKKTSEIRKTPAEDNGKGLMEEIKANFLQSFLAEYLAYKKEGLFAHSAFLQDNGKTYLFMGKSGSGKSTMAEIWTNEFKMGISKTNSVMEEKKKYSNSRQKVFNDDRAILRIQNGKVVFYNAPWIGDAWTYCKPRAEGNIKIDKIFFIYHEKRNIARKLSKSETVTKIFRNIFPVFWNKEALNYSLETCKKISEIVPCYDLGFVHNHKIIDYIRGVN